MSAPSQNQGPDHSAAMANDDQSSTETVEQRLAALQRRLEASEGQRQATEALLQNAEGQRQATEARLRAAEARLRAAEEQNRPSTFVEMLDLHHQHISKPFKVRKPFQSTQGTFTNPKGRYFPTKLRPWTDFSSSQQGRFEKLRKI